MKKKITNTKYKYKHLLLRNKGKKGLLKRRSARYQLVSHGRNKIKKKQTLWFTVKHIEIIRRILYKKISDFPGGFILFRIFTIQPISRKPLQMRMGKGKGKIKWHAVPINHGQRIVDIFGAIFPTLVNDLVKKINTKISSKIRIKAKRHYTDPVAYRRFLYKRKIKKTKRKFNNFLKGVYKVKSFASYYSASTQLNKRTKILTYNKMYKKIPHFREHLHKFMTLGRGKKKLIKLKKKHDNNREYNKNYR